MSFVSIEHIDAGYETKRIFTDFSLQLEPGKIYGILGPNGCGKTTLMKLLGGLKLPTKGKITIGGYPIGVETKKIVSYMTDVLYFAPWMTPMDIEKLFSNFFEDFKPEEFQKILKSFGIGMDQRIDQNSLGTNEKIQMTATLSRAAKLYLLDEPFNGMDVLARDKILKEMLQSFHHESTMLLSTHYIGEVEQLLDYVFFMGDGKILEEGYVDDLREKTGMSLEEQFKELFQNEGLTLL